MCLGITEISRSGIRTLTNINHESQPGRGSAVGEIGALAYLDNVAIRVADVATYLAVLRDWLRDEHGSSALPQFVAGMNIGNAEIHETVDVIRVGGAERYGRLVWGWAASYVQDHPDVRELKIRGRIAVSHAQDMSAEDLLVVVGAVIVTKLDIASYSLDKKIDAC
jgi:hypothetical protein